MALQAVKPLPYAYHVHAKGEQGRRNVCASNMLAAAMVVGLVLLLSTERGWLGSSGKLELPVVGFKRR